MKCIFLFSSLFISVASAATPQSIKVRQDGNNFILESPYGKKVLFGEMGFENVRDFEVTMPVEALYPEKPVASGDPAAMHNFKTDTEALIRGANEAFLASDFKGALGHVNQILEVAPGNVRALMMKGSLMHLMGDKQLAKESWKKALELDPANREISRLLEKYE